MKPILFFIFILASFSVTAQFPKDGQNGYKAYYVGKPDYPPLAIENDRNSFILYLAKPAMFNDPNNKEEVLDSTFHGNKYAYNQRFYYASYKYKNSYLYTVFIYPKMLVLGVTSYFNDAEFEKCKRMLDNQADIYISDNRFKVVAH